MGAAVGGSYEGGAEEVGLGGDGGKGRAGEECGREGSEEAGGEVTSERVEREEKGRIPNSLGWHCNGLQIESVLGGDID